jgi:hypothetical protein
MLAARKLSSDIPTVKCILSLRSEVWNRLRLDESGQRDQTDHFTSLIVRMKDEREQVSAIIRRRLSIASSRIKDGQDYRSFFENDTARAPMSKDYRTWHDLIVVRSRGRPRDAIQLINMLSKRATSDRKLRIDEDVFHAVMPTFSTQIAQKFGQEVAIECPQTLEILRTFAGVYYDSGGFTMSSQQALEHFKASLSRFSVYLYGYSLNQQRESDIFELWRFFYISGVLNGRVTDVDEPQGYRHLDPESDPTLVSKSRWNELQGIVWEMNTAYRDFLIGIQEEQQSRFGLADKTKFRKNPGRSKKR